MGEPVGADASATTEHDDIRLEETSAQYVGAWNQLISTTNWEKGRIIEQWRQAIVVMGAPASSYSDETWSQRAGSVSPQHVGRLRRVYARFHDVKEQYPGLYWSHFQATLDWHDAEMWLEGAVQNGWSVAGMRAKRWEASGAPEDQAPSQEDVVAAELDEDVDPAEDSTPETLSAIRDEVQPAEDDGDWEETADESGQSAGAVVDDQTPDETPSEPIRPFEDLPRLPDDLNEAFEAFKLAILHHKLSGWEETPPEHVLRALEALKQLALAPADQ